MAANNFNTNLQKLNNHLNRAEEDINAIIKILYKGGALTHDCPELVQARIKCAEIREHINFACGFFDRRPAPEPSE